MPEEAGNNAPYNPSGGTPLFSAGTQPQPETPPTYMVYNEQTGQNEIVSKAEADYTQALVTAPSPILTVGLIVVNVAVFILMVINGVGFMDPSIDGLLRWGADFGPLTTHGQWWRLFTSTFEHIGIIHLAMNMYVLLSIGMFTERLFGRVGFLVLYILAGIGGSLTSLAWHPVLVSAGASGSVFGLYGGLLGYLASQRRQIPSQKVMALTKSAGIFLLYNIIYGASKSNVDMGAHLGGFATGLVLGFVLATPLVNFDPSVRLRKALITAVAGTALAAFALARIPALDDFRAEITKFEPIEAASLKLFNESLESLKADKMTTAQFTEAINKKLLPPWNAERDHLAKLHFTEHQAEFAQMLIQYMTLRGEGWSLMAKGAAANDRAIVKSANEKQIQADAVITQMKSWSPR
jgi:rhomboid protease GluP